VQTIEWEESAGPPAPPTLKDFGPSKIALYINYVRQEVSPLRLLVDMSRPYSRQLLLQTISDNTDISTTESVQFTPDVDLGDNSNRL
jgi:hypothetical protein